MSEQAEVEMKESEAEIRSKRNLVEDLITIIPKAQELVHEIKKLNPNVTGFVLAFIREQS